jgi:phosphocarrier protein HPr
MQTRTVRITNRLGLHLRAAAKVVKLASRYRCNVALSRAGRRASARNLMAVIMLAAAMGSTVVVETDGPDEVAAMKALVALIDDHFGEVA